MYISSMSIKGFGFCVLFGLSTNPAMAQQHISVIGDSLSHPIGIQLQRLHPSVVVHRTSLGGTGLVYEYQTWLQQTQTALSSNHPAITYIVLGTNDTNGISVSVPFGSPQWDSAYASRVSAIILIALRYSNRVVWVGAPPMRNQNFSVRVQHLNSVVQQTIQSQNNSNIGFFSCFALFGGTFSEFSTGNERIRETDGIHLTHLGARIIAANIFRNDNSSDILSL